MASIKEENDRTTNHSLTGFRARGIVVAKDASELGEAEKREMAVAEAHEKARRALVYAHMVETCGRIQYGLLHAWKYQPTEQDIADMLDELARRRQDTRQKEVRRQQRQAQEQEAEVA